MATPIVAPMRREGSLLAASDSTQNTTCPGRSSFAPSSRCTTSQLGGKIEETRTRLCCAIFASRSAISKLVSFSLCTPTPVVKKIFLATSCSPWNTLSPPRCAATPKEKGEGAGRRLHPAGTGACELYQNARSTQPLAEAAHTVSIGQLSPPDRSSTPALRQE